MNYKTAEVVKIQFYEEDGYIYCRTLSRFRKDENPPEKVDDCPHQAITDLYNKILPECAKVREWGPDCQQALRMRWRSSPKRQSLDYWEKLFEYIRESDFLMGRTKPIGDHKPFKLRLRWIVKASNFSKIIDGSYHSS